MLFKAKKFLAFLTSEKKTKKAGVPLRDMSDPCLYLKKKKNYINLKM